MRPKSLGRRLIDRFVLPLAFPFAVTAAVIGYSLFALPGSGVVNRGLQITGGRTFSTADSFAAVQSLSVDDATGNFEAAHTAINGTGGTARTITNSAVQNFDATPTRSNQTVSCVTTLATGTANFTIKGVALHNITSGSVTTSSTTLFAGIAGQSITKTSSFSLAITLSVLYTDNS